MNQYRIYTNGQTLCCVYAISLGAALIQAHRHFPGARRPLGGERMEDVGDEVARLAADPEAIDWCRENYRMSPRRAYRVAHHFARENVSQRHDRFSDPLGDWHGRNE